MITTYTQCFKCLEWYTKEHELTDELLQLLKHCPNCAASQWDYRTAHKLFLRDKLEGEYWVRVPCHAH